MGDDGTGDYYSGSMDDLRVYGRVLTPVEVRRLFLGSMNAAGHSGD
jgi:hypothetical protein